MKEQVCSRLEMRQEADRLKEQWRAVVKDGSGRPREGGQLLQMFFPGCFLGDVLSHKHNWL